MSGASIANLPEDLLFFCRLAHQGTLYEYIAGQLNLGDGPEARKVAKHMMITTLFCKPSLKNPVTNKMAKVFPSLIRLIFNFKTAHCYKLLAIRLQQRESEIFIDRILEELKAECIICLTKHDSVLCRRSDVERVKNIMTRILNEELGEHQTAVENY